MKKYLFLILTLLASVATAETGRVKSVGGLTFIDGNARVTGSLEIDRFQELLELSTPTTPSSGRARIFLNGSRICTKFSDASVTCYSSSPGLGTITGVTAGLGLLGGGATGNVTLNLSTPVASAYVQGLNTSTASLQSQLNNVYTASATFTTNFTNVASATTTLALNFPVSISTGTTLTVSGQLVKAASNLSVGPVSFSTGTIGTVDISAQTNLTASGSAMLVGDNVGVGPISLSTGIVGVIQGITNGSNAAAGAVGEYVSSITVAAAFFPTSGTTSDLLAITLTAGDWDIVGQINTTANAATVTAIDVAITTTSGNNFSLYVAGDNNADGLGPNNNTNSSLTLAGVRAIITSTTVYYLKIFALYTVATPKTSGRISARRVR